MVTVIIGISADWQFCRLRHTVFPSLEFHAGGLGRRELETDLVISIMWSARAKIMRKSSGGLVALIFNRRVDICMFGIEVARS